LVNTCNDDIAPAVEPLSETVVIVVSALQA